MVRGYLFFVICRLLSACLEWKERNTIKGSKKEQKFTVMSISMSSVGLFVFLWSDQIPPTPTPAIHFLTSLADFFFFFLSGLFLTCFCCLCSGCVLLCYAIAIATLRYGLVTTVVSTLAACRWTTNTTYIATVMYVCMYVYVYVLRLCWCLCYHSSSVDVAEWNAWSEWTNEWNINHIDNTGMIRYVYASHI